MRTSESVRSESETRESGEPEDGRRRVVIEAISPEIDGGRFPAKRVVGDRVVVEADVFADGHDAVFCVLRYRSDDGPEWLEVAMDPLPNDRWQGTFQVTRVGRYFYELEAWVDRFKSWREALTKQVAAGVDVEIELAIGAQLAEQAAERASGTDAAHLRSRAVTLRGADPLNAADRVEVALSDELAALMARYPDRRFASTSTTLAVAVDRERATYGAWYELFPRSFSRVPGQHGTLRDVEDILSYVASMGFDVLYLPPISPIGRGYRKGRNNAEVAVEDDPGSPWGIGSPEGGHKAVYSQLGTVEDFSRLVRAANKHGIEIALDIAFQCSADHPYVKEHPEWFRTRPDGTIQYAENPPKKYQDIYPLNFETDDWRALWEELRSVFLFWADQGVRVFRVDNPHTKPFSFWEWVIGEVKRVHPDTIFLAEAFTRPKVMYRLAKLGFSQSYTYFAWRNTKRELTEYFTELTQGLAREFFRPALWPNTPDILTEYLQTGGRPAFIVRLVLAATLGATYGVYGPAFELLEAAPREPGSEEYLNSEKYEIKRWDLERADSLQEIMTRVNAVRREHPALHRNDQLRFHEIDNDQLIAYSKSEPDRPDLVLVVVNLDPFHTQSGTLSLPLAELRLDSGRPYQVHDALTDTDYWWNGARNYIELNPDSLPAHLFIVRRADQ
jgi:starch synthase (maltosyl-transferring)